MQEFNSILQITPFKFKLYILRVKDFSQIWEESISSSNVFFNSKKHLQKAFFAKIKIDHQELPFVIKKIASKSGFFSSQNMSIWASKDPSFQAIFKGKNRFSK